MERRSVESRLPSSCPNIYLPKHQESPRQTKPKKGQFMNFSRGHSGTKVRCESRSLSQGKTPEFTKMGEIHELFVLALSLVWFAGATPENIYSMLPGLDPGQAACKLLELVCCTSQTLPRTRGALSPLGNVSETPTPTTCLKSTAVHLQFVRQYAPHLYRRAFQASGLEERETPQYASHLYCSTPPICTAVRPPFVRQYFWKNTGGWGRRNVSEP